MIRRTQSRKQFPSAVLIFSLVVLIAGCGGGGGGTTTTGSLPTPPAISTGIFLDSPVVGINYRTATQSGKTNDRGEFSYLAGEDVTFSVGSAELPAVQANSTVTPLDIARTTDPNHQMVSNIAVFLQSLDDDGDPDNGISISSKAHTAAKSKLDFDVNPATFSSNSDVVTLIAGAGGKNVVPVKEDAARSHLEDTLHGNSGKSKVNVAPVANAGATQNVLVGSMVTLDGTGSSDANGDELSYDWALTAKPTGSSASLTHHGSVTPSFTADLAGTYIASLVVNDGHLNSNAATVTVTATVGNAAPVANAGSAQSVVVGSVVTLDGSASSDANGDTLTYAWSLTAKPAGSSATLALTTTVKPTFTADMAGAYVASLVVNDGKVSSEATTVRVSASVANAAPEANAGPAQNVEVGSTVTLNGAASTDANGDLLTYAWAFVSKPAGSAAALINAASVNPTFVADVAGTYVVGLKVNDGKLNSATITVTITSAVGNVAPVANAGSAQSVVTGTLVTLNGAGSSDANGDLLTYAWAFVSRPAGSAAALANSTSVNPTFTADVAGVYVASLVVNDGKANSSANAVAVTASVANSAPVANAGTAQSIVVGATVTLNGAGSSDANGDALTYAWAFVSRPAGSSAALTNATSVAPTFTADVVGAYVIGLTVNDGKVNSTTATVTVTSAAANVAPVANAGSAQNAEVGAVVTLNGASSSDANGDPLTYAWAFVSRPAGSGAVLTNSTSVQSTFTPDAIGTYVLRLIVNDGTVSSTAATVTVTATLTIGSSTYSDNGDGTLTDQTTGLTWMRCSMGQTWTGSTCSGTASTYTWDQAVTLTTTFASQSDWRLPNIRELQTIVDRSTYHPAIDTTAFPNMSALSSWSASVSAYDSTSAWVGSFDDGSVRTHYRYIADQVRLVRGGQPLSLLNLERPTSDYVDHGNGTVTHTPTGLIWQRCSTGQTWDGSTCTGTANTYTWYQAVALTGTVIFAGQSDWRLPTANELQSLVDYTKPKFNPTINATIFPATRTYYFWSDSPWPYGSGSAWNVTFDVGTTFGYSKSVKSYVRLVRRP